MRGCCSADVTRILLSPGYSLSSCRLHLQGSYPAKFLTLAYIRQRWKRTGTIISSKPLSAELSVPEEEWIKKLPEKKKPLYSHSLPCIEAWLKKVGFYQSSTDRAVWYIERLEWHARLSLDPCGGTLPPTLIGDDMCTRYLKSGPGNLEKDVERRFSYALSREDIENAILGGP